MALEDDILEYLGQAAQKPAEMEQDGRRAKQHRLADLIAAHKYLTGVQDPSDPQGTSDTFGLKMRRIQPGGAA